MIKFLTSLPFLYLFSILLLAVYGWLYYRDFKTGRNGQRRFPLVFSLITLACLVFLWCNIHAGLSFKTFSNLDHHFIRQDGYRSTSTLPLGESDTVNIPGSLYNQFLLAREGDKVTVQSAYAEDPFYIAGEDGRYHIGSVVFPAVSHTVSWKTGSLPLSVVANSDKDFELKVGADRFVINKELKKGATAWELFKTDTSFINSAHYTDEGVYQSLRQVLLLRNDVTRQGGGEMNYFISGKLFPVANTVTYDTKVINEAALRFKTVVPDKAAIAWGIGFLDNNRNQYRLHYTDTGFDLLHRYPLSYPLAEEQRDDWTEHAVSKFLLADQQSMVGMPAIFREGFLFPELNADSRLSFAPVFLHYNKAAGNQPLQLLVHSFAGHGDTATINGDSFTLPAKTTGVSWLFSVKNTFDWDFGNKTVPAKQWQLLLFGSLGLFFLLVMLAFIISPSSRNSWIGQLIAAITIVLLTTRFFLYWRYKTFPPYEGMDLPSQQQLNSISNFYVIILATLAMALVLGFPFFRWVYRKITGRSNQEENFITRIEQKTITLAQTNALIKNISPRILFFGSWGVLLAAGGAIAALNHFDPGVCRHLALFLVGGYFVFIYIAYRHSPLVKAAGEAWWRLDTGRSADMLISNPVKLLLSISLLAAFVFIDIGFAIVFLNFLLFNEVFLCINYAIAGLSAGSKRNATLFGILAAIYLAVFAANLLLAPYIFHQLLNMPAWVYTVGYAGAAIGIVYCLLRVFPVKRRWIVAVVASGVLFAIATAFLPKEKIISKAAVTKYRIDVLTMPVDEAIATAYEEGKNYTPVIRAAQNQWFINTFIDEKNNPAVNTPGFQLLPHAPQNKGAKYNAQATDLVTSRFLIAEHSNWSVLLYVLLLLLPSVMLASFYKLYPDFTNRVNHNYPRITIGFSVLNYLLITALLVIMAATGKYIFFGQDLPFASLLSKQAILFPCLLLCVVVILFQQIPLEYYSNRRKAIPGALLFGSLAILLFAIKPVFNRNKTFQAGAIATEMDSWLQSNLQPVLDHIDTGKLTGRLSAVQKDQLFADSVRQLLREGLLEGNPPFFIQELTGYAQSGFSRHIDANRMIYLDLYSGRPQLAVNENYFRVEPPPHLQQAWRGNVFGDTTLYHVSAWSMQDRLWKQADMQTRDGGKQWLDSNLLLQFNTAGDALYLVNKGSTLLEVTASDKQGRQTLAAGDSIRLPNPFHARINSGARESLLHIEPDAFMRNYYVNGNRYYTYPLGNRFTWARHFAESASADYTAAGEKEKNAFVAFDYTLMDSLSLLVQQYIGADTSYKKGAEYGISIADGNGRIVAMNDYIKNFYRPDPNDKAAFQKAIMGENGFVSQSLLRKQIGNINLLRLNPGPGSTLKPIVFSAVASQLPMDWSQFSIEGFTEKQQYYAGEKVAPYDFEKNNGHIGSVIDYLRYSDNYYHSNILLLGSYAKQDVTSLLSTSFTDHKTGSGYQWPYFHYRGKTYWLNGFEHWPGYANRKADFGNDSSFVSIGLLNNFGIYNRPFRNGYDMFGHGYDSLLLGNAGRNSGFVLPEYPLFDQQGEGVNKSIPYDMFAFCFRGHVKGSSQVLLSPLKMTEAIGKMITQNRDYSLTMNPYAQAPAFHAFAVDETVGYQQYLALMQENVFAGMREALFNGTAARLGAMLRKNESSYFYYAKTGTTGDNESTEKSKLFTLVISADDITKPEHSFRSNNFYTIYFSSQNGPPKQNEELQLAIIRLLERTTKFKKQMLEKKSEGRDNG